MINPTETYMELQKTLLLYNIVAKSTWLHNDHIRATFVDQDTKKYAGSVIIKPSDIKTTGDIKNILEDQLKPKAVSPRGTERTYTM